MHFNLLNHIPLHFKRFCVNDCPEIFTGKEGKLALIYQVCSTDVKQLCRSRGQVNRVLGKVLCASVSGLTFLREMKSQGDGRENLILNSAERVK